MQKMGTNFEEFKGEVHNYVGLTDDSRKVKKGYVFVAVKGLGYDGHDFVQQAVKNGAKVIVGENPLTRIIRSGLNKVKYYQVEDSREFLGKLASEFYGNPSGKLKVIGVTGTKGKTTTCHIIEHILVSLGKKAGILSSISVPGLHVTTPDPIFLQQKLAEFVKQGKEYAIIEVSSHGIDQKRIAGIKFDVGVLTNIAPEHLDYHKTFGEYRRVKTSFVNSCPSKVFWPKKTDVKILPGLYNNLDAEAAVQAVEKLGIKRNDALKTLSTFELPEGRLTAVPNELGIKIIIDFAHTPDSLEAVLTYLKKNKKGKLISVFGCAGERDPGKRFKMGKISAELADLSIFTAEDPRTEDLFEIMNKMALGAKKAGASEGKNFVRIAERGEAIVYALSISQKGDTVAFLGKGHEKSMSFEGFEHPWSDEKVINNFLNRDRNLSAIILAAGKGSRMHSSLPKVLHKICGRPMVTYTLENLRASGIGDITAVISFKRNIVKRYIKGAAGLAIQNNPKGGTADAATAGFAKVKAQTKTLIVINGDDSAFYSPETIKKIIAVHLERERKLTFVSLMKENPTGLGRVVRGKDGLITKIVEEKEATAEEKKIKEVNDGLYVFDRVWFSENIKKVKKSASGELYLVDLVKIAIDQGDKMATYTLSNDDEWQGINTPEELEKARNKMTKKLKSLNE